MAVSRLLTAWSLTYPRWARAFSRFPAEIPVKFLLLIPEEYAYAQVKLIWLDGTQHGVVFTEIHDRSLN